MTTIPELGAELPQTQLDLRSQLPLKPDPVTLTGERVRLVPLDLERDAAPLYALSNGQPIAIGERHYPAYDPELLIWRFMYAGPFAGLDAFRDYMKAQVDAADGLCLRVEEVATGQPVGVVNYMTNVPAHLKIELGSIWYSPIAQRTGANTEATLQMLAHAFDLGYRRVEWKCNALNLRSRQAALRMGFQFEAIQEAHYIAKGRNRDTAWFRILDREWPEVRQQLQTLLTTTTR
ncbi:MAG: GNAT family N-acetyltransferase [Chloroflexota bacterium]|nr:GNAT family N-acetyltransferase [Chloroflexota bacterium]